MLRTAPLFRFLTGLGAIGLWIVLWWFLTRPGGLVPALYFPSPDAVWTKFVRMWMRPYIGSTLLEHIFSSLYIVMSGWSLAAIVGIPLGIVMAWWPKIKWIVFPIFQIIRPVPPLAWTDYYMARYWRCCSHVSGVRRSPGSVVNELNAGGLLCR